jgi:hypothetical protein
VRVVELGAVAVELDLSVTLDLDDVVDGRP